MSEPLALPVIVQLDAKTGQIRGIKPEGEPIPASKCIEIQRAKPPEAVVDGIATLHVCAVKKEEADKLKEWHDPPNQRLDRKDSVTI